jgi:hypothetical protein
MKRLHTLFFFLVMAAAAQAIAQPSAWQFVKVFPDTSFISSFGVAGLTVAPDGNIWVAPAWAVDSIQDNGGTWWPVVQIFVFRPDGTPLPYSGFKTIKVGAMQDSLFNGTNGMRKDAQGNIVYATYDAYYKINYKTGQGLAKVIPLADNYVVTPAFTSANELFVAYILPGNPILLYDNSFGLLGTAVVSAPGYSRSFEVSKDGNEIYWAGYSLNKVLVYHSDNGTLGPYVLKDSLAHGLQVESFAWNTRNGYLYMSGGNVDTTDYGPFLPGHAPMKWIGFDVATKSGKDTIAWNWNAYPYARTAGDAPRPRAIDFSVTGDTAYVACFLAEKAAVQMFRRVPTGVSQSEELAPANYELAQNYPNPFNPSTTIRYGLPNRAHVMLTVFNALGQQVALLQNGEQEAGYHEVRFDGSGLSSGVYFYRIEAGSFTSTRKLLLIQ